MHPLLLSLVFLTSTLSWTVVEVSSVPRKDSSSSALIEQSHLQRRAENSNNNNNKKKNNKNNNDPQDAHARQVQALNQHMVTQAGKYRGEICAWCMKSCVENTVCLSIFSYFLAFPRSALPSFPSDIPSTSSIPQ